MQAPARLKESFATDTFWALVTAWHSAKTFVCQSECLLSSLQIPSKRKIRLSTQTVIRAALIRAALLFQWVTVSNRAQMRLLAALGFPSQCQDRLGAESAHGLAFWPLPVLPRPPAGETGAAPWLGAAAPAARGCPENGLRSQIPKRREKSFRPLRRAWRPAIIASVGGPQFASRTPSQPTDVNHLLPPIRDVPAIFEG